MLSLYQRKKGKMMSSLNGSTIVKRGNCETENGTSPGKSLFDKVFSNT